MKKSITVTLDDEDLLELERIILDNDCEGAVRFPKRLSEIKREESWREEAVANPGMRFLGRAPT